MMEKDASTRATLKMGRGGEQGDTGPTCESKAHNGCDAISSHRQEAKQYKSSSGEREELKKDMNLVL
jgi:hypothetical protein